MVGLGRCFDDNGNFDLENYYLSRQKRRREEEAEEADGDDGGNGRDKLKKRPYKSRRYWGYYPEDALTSEWYRRYVSGVHDFKVQTTVSNALH